MVKREFIIRNKVGLHARPASLLVQTAKKFKSKIIIYKNEEKANAKSIINVLSLGVEKDTKIVIEVDGEDEREALETIENLIKNDFEESDEKS